MRPVCCDSSLMPIASVEFLPSGKMRMIFLSRMRRSYRYDGRMTQLVSISANTAALAFESLRIPQRVATGTAIREARKIVERQLNPSGEDPEETTNIIQNTEVALDLMTKGFRQPQAGLKQALQSYEDV